MICDCQFAHCKDLHIWYLWVLIYNPGPHNTGITMTYLTSLLFLPPHCPITGATPATHNSHLTGPQCQCATSWHVTGDHHSYQGSYFTLVLVHGLLYSGWAFWPPQISVVKVCYFARHENPGSPLQCLHVRRFVTRIYLIRCRVILQHDTRLSVLPTPILSHKPPLHNADEENIMSDKMSVFWTRI